MSWWGTGSIELAASSDANVSLSSSSRQGLLKQEIEVEEEEALLPQLNEAASQRAHTPVGPAAATAVVESASSVPDPDPEAGDVSIACKAPKLGRKSVAFADEPTASYPAPSDEGSSTSGTFRWRGGSLSVSTGPTRPSLVHHHSPQAPAESWTWTHIKHTVTSISREVLPLYHVLSDSGSQLDRMARVLPWLVLQLARSPLNLVPDFLPIISTLNHLLVMPTLVWCAVQCVPREVMQDARRRAEQGPVLISRTWGTPLLIWFFWLAVLEVLLFKLMRISGSDVLLENQGVILFFVGGFLTLAFGLWLSSLTESQTGEWELLLMYGVDHRERDTLHWLADVAPEVSHNRRADYMRGVPMTP